MTSSNGREQQKIKNFLNNTLGPFFLGKPQFTKQQQQQQKPESQAL